MKFQEALKKAEEVEKTVLLIRKPTKKLWGYAVKLEGDPTVKIMRINFGTKQETGFTINKKRYKVVAHMSIPIRLAQPLIDSIQSLLEMEI